MKKRIISFGIIISMISFFALYPISVKADEIIDTNSEEVIEELSEEAIDPEVLVDDTDEETLFSNDRSSATWPDTNPDSTMMKIENGMAQPIIDYSYNVVPDTSYSNTYQNEEGEKFYYDVLRFCVYVETDYDTDMDGYNDLVQALIQVPTAAVMGKYQAPTIFHASPYIAGNSPLQTARFNYDVELNGFKESDLYYAGNRTRELAQEEAVSSLVAAENTNFSEWHYQYEALQEDANLNDQYYIAALNNHDYFLVRGFAIVLAAGLGTNGSEGLETCGSAAERDAFKSIVEWIHGDPNRIAYTDREHNIPIKAEWANGNVAMEGLSYDGTMAYEVATTGVEGLKTIVPGGAISSWYDYSNKQGLSLDYNGKDRTSYDYTTTLASACASRFYGKDSTADESLLNLYNKWLRAVEDEQNALKGCYGQYWDTRNYTYPTQLKASALIVQGLNDYNVNAKQADLMRQAFINNHRDVKVLLHQGAHEFPEYMKIGGYLYDEILNMWYCHYLLDVDNDVLSTIPDYWVQSNVDGKYMSVDKWDNEDNDIVMSSDNSGITHILAGDGNQNSGSSGTQTPEADISEPDLRLDSYYTIDDFYEDNPEALEEQNEKQANRRDTAGLLGNANETDAHIIKIDKDITEDLTVNGKAEVHLKIAVDDPQKEILLAGVMLYDVADTNFDAYELNVNVIERNVTETEIDRGGNLDKVYLQEYQTKSVSKKLISKGAINLRVPNASYAPETATTPEKAIEAGQYNDYVIYMIPTVYTVKEGHHLELLILPEIEEIATSSGFLVDNSSIEAYIPIYPTQNGGGMEEPEVTKYPSAKSNLVYTGTAQDLIDPGTVNGGTMQYALGDSNAATGEYSAAIPSMKDAGTYYVWYKVVADADHLESSVAERLDIEISKKPIASISNIKGVDKEYDGTTTATITGDIAETANGDTLYITADAVFENADADQAKTISYSNLSVTGTSSGNYEYTGTTTGTTSAAISKRATKIIANDQTVEATGSIATGTGRVTFTRPASGHVLSSITLTSSSTQTATKNGTITPSGATIIIKDTSVDVTSNYDIEYVTGKLTVNAKKTSGGSSSGSGSGSSSGSKSNSSSSGSSSGSSSSGGGTSSGGNSSNVGGVNYDELYGKLSSAISNIYALKALNGGKGGTIQQQIVTWDKGDALPYNAMKTLQDNPNITLVFKCTYGGMNFTFAIPGSAVKANPLVPWCGPLYLLTYYGQYAVASPFGAGPLNTNVIQGTPGIPGQNGMYVVKRGDTLSKLAKQLKTTVNNLVKLNNIKNKNVIFPGQVLKY